MKRNSVSRKRSDVRLAAALLAPTVLILLVVLVAPTIFAAVYSLMELDYAKVAGFAGLDNWRKAVFNSAFLRLAGQTAVFVVGALVLTVAISFPIALALDRMRSKLATFFQLVVILPWVLSTIVGALLFRWTFLETLGIGAWVADTFHVTWEPLLTPTGAAASMIVSAAWRTVGFAVIILLAGIKAIDHELYEAADVDGASALEKFWYITLPLIRTPLTIVTVILLLSNLNNVEIPLVVTGGGPAGATDTFALEIYKRAFNNLDFGGSAALATATAIINIALVAIYVKFARRS